MRRAPLIVAPFFCDARLPFHRPSLRRCHTEPSARGRKTSTDPHYCLGAAAKPFLSAPCTLLKSAFPTTVTFKTTYSLFAKHRGYAPFLPKSERNFLRTASSFIWTFQRSAATFPCYVQRKPFRDRKIRRPPRHPRPHGPQNSPRPRPTAWLRHRPPHRAGQRRRPQIE